MADEDTRARIEKHVRRWAANAHLRPAEVKAPGPGQESVWDYPRPPSLVRSAATVRVELAGALIAETGRAIRVCETASPPVFYLPPGDVRSARLEPARGGSLCEWKGQCTYWDVVVGDARAAGAAFAYAHPLAPFEALASYVGFYPGRVACWVDAERVRPQEGGFYAGWVTDRIVGPYKGAPGTGGW